MHTRRNHLILVGLIMAAVVGVALLGVPGSPAHKKTRLGLDLQGGVSVVLCPGRATTLRLRPPARMCSPSASRRSVRKSSLAPRMKSQKPSSSATTWSGTP